MANPKKTADEDLEEKDDLEEEDEDEDEDEEADEEDSLEDEEEDEEDEEDEEPAAAAPHGHGPAPSHTEVDADYLEPGWWIPHVVLGSLIVVGVLGFFGFFTPLFGRFFASEVDHKTTGSAQPSASAPAATAAPTATVTQRPQPTARPSADPNPTFGAKRIVVQYAGAKGLPVAPGSPVPPPAGSAAPVASGSAKPAASAAPSAKPAASAAPAASGSASPTAPLPTRTKEEAKARAEEALKEIKAGSKFEEVAAKYSDEPGAKTTGGNLGNFKRGVYDPVLEKMVEKTKVGEVSEIFETQYGYEIITRTK